MTQTEKLKASGWSKVRADGNECGQAIVSKNDLEDLACSKSATWKREGMEYALCAQHALLARPSNAPVPTSVHSFA